ncbi:MAG: glycosyltransferase [Prevotellaceae bacterium]|jgi:glycosyltransferase involved in cell wall biosynthesis|nr:glycosyltransferase [Prevotellaceae bacterium]
MHYYSVIIPVYNRPQEIEELLESLSEQSVKNFEVIIVEDGSTLPSEQVAGAYKKALSLSYYAKPNTGPGESRNYGAAKSRGDYLIVFDSDCIIPAHYFEEVEKELNALPCDAFGGPDAAHDSFSHMQKAVNYAMTSFFTTGGIRGGKKQLETFHPRSFNMGIKREVYEALGGFSSMRYGEDIDFSIRIFGNGYKARLFPHAFVFHKRRTNLRKFFWQVYHSGAARIALYERHPSSLRMVHFLPALFVSGSLFFAVCSFWCLYSLTPLLLYAMLTGVDATIKNKHVGIGGLSVGASFVQLFGYGTGFLTALIRKIIFKTK